MRLVPFGEEKHASMGMIEDMEFFVGDVKTRAKVEVVDLPQQLFLLGTDWLHKERGIIDFGIRELQLKTGSGIPIKFVEMMKVMKSMKKNTMTEKYTVD